MKHHTLKTQSKISKVKRLILTAVLAVSVNCDLPNHTPPIPPTRTYFTVGERTYYLQDQLYYILHDGQWVGGKRSPTAIIKDIKNQKQLAIKQE